MIFVLNVKVILYKKSPSLWQNMYVVNCKERASRNVVKTFAKSFLAHLSRRLEWAIVIAHCPSSIRLSVRPSVRRKLFTFSTSSPEPLNGFWWNFVRMKYSWSLTSFVVFRPDPPRGGSRAGQNKSLGVPFFSKLLLPTRRLQQQMECIAVI